MIIISKTSRERENAIERRINLMNLFIREKERNLQENETISKKIDKKITKLSGRKYNHTYLNTKTMEATKSDPRAALGEFDPLSEISDAIHKEALLPGYHPDYERTLEIVLAMKYSNSFRIHSHTIDERLYKPLQDVVTGISVADSEVIYPATNKDEKKKNLKRISPFKKLAKKEARS